MDEKVIFLNMSHLKWKSLLGRSKLMVEQLLKFSCCLQNIGGDIQQKGRDLAGAVTQNTPDLPSAGQIGSEIQKNTPDLPSPQGLFDKLQGK